MSTATVFEVHPAIVTDNVDPEQRGRIKVTCETLVETGTELPDWVDPAFPYLASSDQQTTTAGWFFVPDIGCVVEVEVASDAPHDEVPGAISFDAPQIRWRAAILARDDDTVGSEFLENYPNRRGIQTGLGHAIVFDDTDNDPEVKLQWSDGAGGFAFIDFDENGSMTALTKAGNMIFMNDPDKELSIVDLNENALVMNADGVYIATTDSDMVKIGGSEISLFTGDLLINATGVSAQVGGFSIQQASLDTAVVVEGLGVALTAALSLVMTEIIAIGAGIPAGVAVPAPNAAILKAALDAGAHTATLLTTE